MTPQKAKEILPRRWWLSWFNW